MNNDYLGEIEHFLDAYREDGDEELIANPIAYHWLTVGALRAAATELKLLRAQVGEEEVSWAVCAGYDADGDEIYHSTAEEYARDAATKGIPVTKWVTRVYPTTVYDMELNEGGEWQEVGDGRLAEG